MKAALYIRVSTAEQVENYSIESQRERLEAFCKSKGWTVYDVYIDGGYSGASTERPALQQMLKDLPNIDAVVVYKLDRLSRSQKDTLELIEEHFLKNNVDFVSITETLDTSTPFGKAMIGILSVFAQLERETIAERMRMGHIKRAEEGLRGMGGNYDPAGYKRKNGELVINEEEAKHVQEAYNLYELTHSITKVQAQLKELQYPVWRFRRYNDILRSKLYCGYVSFAGEHYKGKHDPIITEDQFDRVQILLSRHKGRNAGKAKESLLSGLMVCSICGEQFVTHSCMDRGKKYRYYLCRARRFSSEYDKKCMNKSWNAEKLEGLIIEELNSFIVDKRVDKKETHVINYDALLQKVDDKVGRILSLYEDGKLPKELLNKRLDLLDIEKKDLYLKKFQQNQRLTSIITKSELKQDAFDLMTADFPKRHSIIQKLINQIHITGENVEIEWNFQV
jgi:site-specific DNA recombinase